MQESLKKTILTTKGISNEDFEFLKSSLGKTEYDTLDFIENEDYEIFSANEFRRYIVDETDESGKMSWKHLSTLTKAEVLKEANDDNEFVLPSNRVLRVFCY
ncbi:hypothetical protein [Lactococcus fujiensis]|uniref:Uncharacterized protein n=1 Tax=Lactococcus fujiensis JCM 16395 TaxID=1291764 RepID=A0A2A5RII9_9LACT|nr:hypothetical protein [Lactococcus fujiensis]PCR98893.1 hypothetical protein RT41_GL000632 [Lactococcus fujiensis JCM 16395]